MSDQGYTLVEYRTNDGPAVDAKADDGLIVAAAWRLGGRWKVYITTDARDVIGWGDRPAEFTVGSRAEAVVIIELAALAYVAAMRPRPRLAPVFTPDDAAQAAEDAARFEAIPVRVVRDDDALAAGDASGSVGLAW